MTLFIFSFIFLVQNSFAKEELICREKVEMWTNFKICLYVDPSQKLNVDMDIQDSFKKLNQIEKWLSEWIEDSQLSKVNHAAGAQAISVNENLYELIKFSLDVARNSHGYFDPSFNALWGLYNFKKG